MQNIGFNICPDTLIYLYITKMDTFPFSFRFSERSALTNWLKFYMHPVRKSGTIPKHWNHGFLNILNQITYILMGIIGMLHTTDHFNFSFWPNRKWISQNPSIFFFYDFFFDNQKHKVWNIVSEIKVVRENNILFTKSGTTYN